MTAVGMLGRAKALLREPALLIDLAETLLVALVAFGVHLSNDQETYIVAVLVALAGLTKAFTTTPFPVTAVTDLGRAALTLMVSFGLHLSADQTAILITLLGTITTLVSRPQITPRSDAVIGVGGSGAGPVSSQTPTSSKQRERGETG